MTLVGSNLAQAGPATGGGDVDLTAHEGAGDPHTVYQLESEKGEPLGYVGLNALGQIDSIYLPAFQGFVTVEVADEAARLALTTDPDTARLAIQQDDNSKWIINAGDDPSVSGNWIGFTFVAPVESVDGQTGAVVLTGIYAELTGGVVAEADIDNAIQRVADAQATYSTRVGAGAGDTAVLALDIDDELTFDFAETLVGSITLDADVTAVNLANVPAAGTYGLLKGQIHQAAAGTTFDLPDLTSLVDVWRNGPPTMPQTHSALIEVIVEAIEGVTYGTWSKPAVKLLQLGPVSDPNGSSPTSGNGKAWFLVPAELDGYTLIDVEGAVTTVGSTASSIMIANDTDAVDMLSTAITVDASEKTSVTAATPPVVNAANAVVSEGDLLRLDLDTVGTGSKGHLASLTFQAPPT